MRIYQAGMFARRDEFVENIALMEQAGHSNGARWLTDETNMEGASDEERQRFAIMDMEDVAKCELVIAYTEEGEGPGTGRGGRHVEFGAAIAMNKEVVIVGPRENVFHYLPGLMAFDTLEDALAWINKEIA